MFDRSYHKLTSFIYIMCKNRNYSDHLGIKHRAEFLPRQKLVLLLEEKVTGTFKKTECASEV